MPYKKYVITFPIGYAQSLWIASVITCRIAGPPRRGSTPQESDLRPFSAFEGGPAKSTHAQNFRCCPSQMSAWRIQMRSDFGGAGAVAIAFDTSFEYPLSMPAVL